MLKKILLLLTLTISSGTLFDMEPDKAKLHLELEFCDIAACLQACKSGDLKTMQWFLEEGNVDSRTILPKKIAKLKGSTFLHWSVEHPAIMQLLIDRRALLDASDDDQWTPLLMAVDKLQPRSVELLLSKGASPSLKNLYMDTPLHKITHMAMTGFIGIKLTPMDKKRITLSIVHLLKAKNASCFLTNYAMNTPIHYAAACEDTDIFLSVFLPHGMSERLAKEARARVLTVLCLGKRLPLPQETIVQILSYLALDCKHADIEHWIVPIYVDQETFTNRYVQEIVPMISAAITPEERNSLNHTLISPNSLQKTPKQSARNPMAKKLLDPLTWQFNSQTENI